MSNTTLPEDLLPFFKGRVALHAILRAAGIGPGDRVLLPGYTCVVVPNAVLYCGAEPAYVDVDPATGNLDPLQIDPAGAKALIIQHTFGLPCDLDGFRQLADRHGLFLIEDSCHALGAGWNGRPVGSVGDAAFFSSQWSKPLTTGLGGWARINNPELRRKLDDIRDHYPPPQTHEALLIDLQYLAYRALYSPRLSWVLQSAYRRLGGLGIAIGSSSSEELDCRQPSGYEKAMHPLQRRRLGRALTQVGKMIQQRRNNAQRIAVAFRERDLPTVEVPPGADPVWLRYPLFVANKVEVLAAARRRRVRLGDWFLSPVHPNLEDWESAAYRAGSCPTAERMSHMVINVPTDGDLNQAEIERTADFLATHVRGACLRVPEAET